MGAGRSCDARGLVAERALLTTRPDDEVEPLGMEADADDAGSDEEDSDEGTALAAFAADPATPAELASREAAWREQVRYGLWRVDDPAPTPGLWCTEILTGVSRYVEFPADVAGLLPRLAVWLGAVVPVDGIWRCTGTGMRLSPAEADAAAELVDGAATALIEHLGGRRRHGMPGSRCGSAAPSRWGCSPISPIRWHRSSPGCAA
jgi:hypothetical protein